MVEVRQLTDDEKRTVHRNIQFIKEDLEFLEASGKQIRTAIEIAPLMYKRQIKEMEARLKQNNALIEEHKNAVIELERQIKEGVEVKKKDEEVKS